MAYLVGVLLALAVAAGAALRVLGGGRAFYPTSSQSHAAQR